MKKLHENIYVSGQLTTHHFQELSDNGVKVIINNRPDHEEPGQMTSAEAGLLAEQLGISYHYLPMANNQPLPATLIDDFKNIVEATDEPVLAHCRSGMRSSFLWAMGQIAAGVITADQAILAAQNAGIPLANARTTLESAQP